MGEAAKLLQEVGSVAASHNATVEQVAIAWVLAKGAVCLLGTRRKEHAIDGFKALDLQLSADDVARLDSAALEDDGMYNMLLSQNVFTRAISKRIPVPLLQDPLPKPKL